MMVSPLSPSKYNACNLRTYLLSDDVDNAREFVVLSDRHLNGSYVQIQFALYLSDRSCVVSAHAIQFIDEDDPGQIVP